MASLFFLNAMKPSLYNISTDELENLLGSLEQPGYRARQIIHWVYKRLAGSFDEMTDLPVEFRTKINKRLRLHTLELISTVTSSDSLTEKALFRLIDGNTVETVLMDYPSHRSARERRTLCLSTQVGCAYSCSFCATGKSGFVRNLNAGEMVEQVLYFSRHIRLQNSGSNQLSGKRKEINNVVFMGMGEPLANYRETLKAVRTLNTSFGLAARQMTISTVGLIPGIRRLAQESLQVGLSVSLHAPNDALREQLMPINNIFPLHSVLEACHYYVKKTGRHITFEYILIGGVNDSPSQAVELGELLKGFPCQVNLIPINPSPDLGFHAPTQSDVMRFQRHLQQMGVNCTLRISRGQDIKAGCGQLRGVLINGSYGKKIPPKVS